MKVQEVENIVKITRKRQMGNLNLNLSLLPRRRLRMAIALRMGVGRRRKMRTGMWLWVECLGHKEHRCRWYSVDAL